MTWNVVRQGGLLDVEALALTPRLSTPSEWHQDAVAVQPVDLTSLTDSPPHALTPSYFPALSRWNTLKSYENILNQLGADIICFQGAAVATSIPRDETR